MNDTYDVNQGNLAMYQPSVARLPCIDIDPTIALLTLKIIFKIRMVDGLARFGARLAI